ncbi:MAG: sigma-70 family RNA polymerase sigma factor [Bacteroidia bacterium]
MQTPTKAIFTDQQILEEIRKENTLSSHIISSLYQEKGAGGYYYVLKESGGKHNEAKDVLQEAIVSFVFQVKTGKLTSVENLRAYLKRSCMNIWLNRHQKKKPEVADMSTFVNILVDNGNASDLIEQEDRATLIQQVLGLLKEKCKKVLFWAIVEEQPMTWIAEQLGFETVQAAMNQNYRCKKELVLKVAEKPAYTNLVKQLLRESQSH